MEVVGLWISLRARAGITPWNEQLILTVGNVSLLLPASTGCWNWPTTKPRRRTHIIAWPRNVYEAPRIHINRIARRRGGDWDFVGVEFAGVASRAAFGQQRCLLEQFAAARY